MKISKLVFSLSIFTFLFFIGINYSQAQTRNKAIKNVSWQTSVNDSERGKVVLGLRDKWAELGKFTASFVVISPTKKKFKAQIETTDDGWAYVDFPSDFDGLPRSIGTYTVNFYADGVFIRRDQFKFRPKKTVSK